MPQMRDDDESQMRNLDGNEKTKKGSGRTLIKWNHKCGNILDLESEKSVRESMGDFRSMAHSLICRSPKVILGDFWFIPHNIMVFFSHTF